MNIDKKSTFWTTYPPLLVNVVCKRPLILFSNNCSLDFSNSKRIPNPLIFSGTWGRNRRQVRNNHRSLVPSISDPVPILQPPTATVSEYARKIEILATDLANGSAMTPEVNDAGQ